MDISSETLTSSYLTIFLAVFYTVVALFYTVLIKLRNSARCNATLVNMGSLHSMHWWNHLTFRFFRVAIWAVCVWHVFDPQVDQYVYVLRDLIHPPIQIVGAIMMMLGFALAIYCNVVLDNSWRSGVDAASKPGLVTHLIYARSRNPSYIGVAISQFGFFFAWPSVFSLICLVVGVIALRIQIHLEEQFLLDMYADEYKMYIASVPRYL